MGLYNSGVYNIRFDTPIGNLISNREGGKESREQRVEGGVVKLTAIPTFHNHYSCFCTKSRNEKKGSHLSSLFTKTLQSKW